MTDQIADIIFTIGSIVFIVALLPTVFGDDLPKISTSLVTSVTLYLFSMTYAEIGLYFAAISSLVLASLWNIIFIRKWEQGGKSTKKTISKVASSPE